MIMSELTSLRKEKLLIIEADAVLGGEIAQALKKDGYNNVFLATNGTEGLKKIYDLLPHLVLVDVALPEIDGYGVLQKKQAEPLLAKIPVFLMSMQGVPINMRSVPAGSVSEFLMAMHADSADIVRKVNRHFNYVNIVPAAKNSAPSIGGSKKILWVEDDRLIGVILAKKLIASGFDLTHAKNGEEALASLASSIPDAIVVDLLLPGMSGFDILQRTNMDPRLKKVPTMVLSNLSKPSDIEKAHTLGAKKFLVKASTSLDQIVSEVKELAG